VIGLSFRIKMASLSAAASPNFADDDGVRTFLSELKLLVDDCFLELNTMVTKEFSDTENRHARFKKGLKAIENWDSAVRGEETAHALQRFPTIAEKEYKHASTAFIRATTNLSGMDLSGLKVRVPPFDMFLFYFFREIARSASMKNGDYFTMRYMDKDRYLCDMLYIVMRECLEVLDDSAPKTKPASWRTALATDDRLDRRVVPGDSVSCVGTVTPRDKASTVVTIEPQAQASMVLIKRTDPENPVFIKADTQLTTDDKKRQTFSVIKSAEEQTDKRKESFQAPSVETPSKAPSVAPQPSKAPSKAPSVAPQPSKAPSVAPPSKAPSVALQPSKAPSVAPQPSGAPSVALSKAPSVLVTKRASTVITTATDERVVEVSKDQHSRIKPPLSRRSSSSSDDED